MSDHLKHHKELDEKDEGKCSVPMWAGGLPNGFCDKVAYGFPEGRSGGYDLLQHVPFLACHMHGGPKHNEIVIPGEMRSLKRPDITKTKRSVSAKDLLDEYFIYWAGLVDKGQVSSLNMTDIEALGYFAEWCDEKLTTTHPTTII